MDIVIHSARGSAEEIIHQLASLLSSARLQRAVSDKQFQAILRKDILIPCSIFSEDLSSLEAIILYLRDALHLKNKDVAILLNRDDRAVSRTYAQGKKKRVKPFKIDFSYSFPVAILATRKMSVLETIVYALEKEYSLQEISTILHRTYKTIWTVHARASKK